MILVTHGIIGAAVGRLFPDKPWLALIAGVASHFLTDAIPHWHYPLISEKRDPNNKLNYDLVLGKKFLVDLMKIGTDFAAGVFFAILFFQGWAGFSNVSLAVLLGALGGIAPDPVSFLYMKWRHEPLLSFQRFHLWSHSKVNIDQKHLIGIGSQTLIMVAAVFLSSILL